MSENIVGMGNLATVLLGFTIDVSTTIEGESYLVAHSGGWFRIFKLQDNEAMAVHSWNYSGPPCNNIVKCRDYAVASLVRWYLFGRQAVHIIE